MRRLCLTYLLIIFNVFSQQGTKLKIREEHNLFISKVGNWVGLLSLGLHVQGNPAPRVGKIKQFGQKKNEVGIQGHFSSSSVGGLVLQVKK